MKESFYSRSKCIVSEANLEAETIIRSGRDKCVRLRLLVFTRHEVLYGSLDIDRMASSSSGPGNRLRGFTRYAGGSFVGMFRE